MTARYLGMNRSDGLTVTDLEGLYLWSMWTLCGQWLI